MTCTTCGRENPPHLTFCQECGQRLGPRIAPPTPPIGLGAEYSAPMVQASGKAPDLPPPAWLAPTAQAAPIEPAHAPQPPPATTAPVRCRVCETPNAAGLRYCTSCGSTLEAPPPVTSAMQPHDGSYGARGTLGLAAAAQGAPVASPAQPPHPAQNAQIAQTAQAAFPAIAPNRVVELGGGAPAPMRAPRTCGRCRGTVDPGAQFCKFCGAPLADAEPAIERPPVVARTPDVSPLLPHERLELPKPAPSTSNGNGNGNGAPPALAKAEPVARPATAPTPAVAPTSPPVVAAQAILPAQADRPAQPVAQVPPVQSPVARALTRGRLVVIAKSGADGPSYPVGDTLDIGRAEGNVVVGEDPYLSPRHVRIAWTGTKLVLRDLASTNGVYLRLSPSRDMNAVRRNAGGPAGSGAGGRGPHQEAEASGEVAVPLHDQDLILVGQQVLKFEVVPNSFDAGLGPAVEHSTLLFGSPAAPRYARLGQRTVEGITRDVYYVRKMETVLGRESGDIVFTEDPFLSRRHAAVRVLGRDGAPLPAGAKPTASDGVQFALVDLGSSNGTFLRIRGEVDLVSGDHFRVGQQLFRIDFEAPGQRAGDDGVRAG